MTPTLWGRWQTRLFLLGWDFIYQAIVSFRWDGDWPSIFQIGAGVLEGVWIWILVHYVGFPGVNRSLLLWQFIPHYATVWLAVFTLSQGPLRALLPRWRYRGGQWF